MAGCEAIFTSHEFACEEYSGQLVVEVVSATDQPAMDLWVSLHSLWPLRPVNPGTFESHPYMFAHLNHWRDSEAQTVWMLTLRYSYGAPTGMMR